MAKQTSKVWYLVGLGLIAATVGIAIFSFMSLSSKIESLQRVVMPGNTAITLPAGESTLYAETSSMVDGKSYHVVGEFSFQCAVLDEQNKQVEIKRPSGEVKYSLFGYSGQNALDVEAPAPGTYRLVCESPMQFVMAIGSGIGSGIVLLILGSLVPALGGAILILVVWLKRRSQARRARAAAPIARVVSSSSDNPAR